MKLTDKISWLMGRVQRSLFPHLNQCLTTPLTKQEERLVSILEILQVEPHAPKHVTRYQYSGCKPRDRQCLARAFTAKALYRFPTTIDLRRGLQSVANLRYQYIDRNGDPDLGFDGILGSPIESLDTEILLYLFEDSSTCQRLLYSSAMVIAGMEKLLVRNTKVLSVTAS